MKWHGTFLSSLLVMMSFFPLIFSFGSNFEYEYVTVLAWVLVVTLPAFALLIPRSLVERIFEPRLPIPPGQLADFRKLLLWASVLVVGPGLLLLAPAGAFASGQCLCGSNGFLFWFAVQALPAYFFGMALHVAILHWRIRQRRTFLVALGCGALLISFLIGLAGMLWFFPQKRILSLVFGFIHGPIYDEWIVVDSGVVVGRLALIFLSLSVVQYLWSKFNKSKSTMTWRILGSTGVILWFSALFSSSGGHGKESLRALLPQEERVGFMVVHFATGHAGQQQRMRVLLKEAHFHSQEIIAKLGITNPRPVNIFVYPSKDLKKLYFGGGATDVTDVWTPSVHITADQAPHATLRHELVHAISSEFGWHGLGFHPNIALTEGLAVALAPPGERLSIHSLSASLLQSGKISSLEELFSPLGFWSQSGPRAYTVAGSFLQFLFEQAGAESVRKIYSGTNFLAATGHTLPYWSSKWRKFIDTQFDPKLTMQSEALFRSKGLLREKCPHTKADLQRPRSDGLWTRLRQPVGWDRAQYLQWLSSFDQSDRGGKINLWLNRIKESAMAHSGSKLGMTTWLEVVQRARYKPSKTVEDVELGVIESDVLAFLGRTTESLDVLSELQAEFAVASPGDAIERQIYARFLIQRSGASGTHVLEWRKYLAGWRSLPEADPSDHWIMSYLRMRRDTRASLLAASAHLLMPVDDMDPKFRSEWHKILADRFFNAEEFTSAASQYRSGANLAIGDQRTNLEMLVRLMEMH